MTIRRTCWGKELRHLFGVSYDGGIEAYPGTMCWPIHFWTTGLVNPQPKSSELHSFCFGKIIVLFLHLLIIGHGFGHRIPLSACSKRFVFSVSSSSGWLQKQNGHVTSTAVSFRQYDGQRAVYRTLIPLCAVARVEAIAWGCSSGCAVIYSQRR